MKKIRIAFDVDGTLRDNAKPYEHGDTSEVKWNWRICDLAVCLSSLKNTELIIWSGGGKEYAEKIMELFHEYVHPRKKVFKSAHSKLDADKLEVDIAIDDIHDCNLGKLNLIVREK